MAHPLLVEGVSDAIGFVAGALVAYGIARLLGFDPMTSGYDSASILGIALAGLGGGIGLHLARRWRQGRAKADEDAS